MKSRAVTFAEDFQHDKSERRSLSDGASTMLVQQSGHGSDWEVHLQGEWKMLGVVERDFLEKLERDGKTSGTLTVQEKEYEYDIDSMHARNLKTGKVHDIRRKEIGTRMTKQKATIKMTAMMTLSRMMRSFTKAIEEPVRLHVYDVGTDPKVGTANGILRVFGSGAYHAAVEIYELEWSYGYTEDNTGVFWCEPGKCEMHSYRECIELGKTRLSREEVEDLLDELSTDPGPWEGQNYNLLRHNCCHFSNEFAKRLGVGEIPGWIMALANTGASAEDAYMKYQEIREMGAQERLGVEDSNNPIGSYRYGDVARGIVAHGKELRGASRKSTTHFADCCRGACHLCCAKCAS